MKRWLIAASLIFCLLPARAGQPQDPTQILTKQFTSQEQILLAGVLADPRTAQEFAQDASGPATQAVFDKWRQRVALFSRDYINGPHPIDDTARSVKDMVAPAEWQMLMTSLRMLSNGGLADQAKFRIFLAMIDNANDDLAANPPDTRNAHKVIALGRSKVSEAMKEYLASPTGSAALAAAQRQKPAPATTAAVPAVAAPKPAPKTKPKPTNKALAQAQSLQAAMQISAPEDAGQEGDQAFDGAGRKSENQTPVSESGAAEQTTPPVITAGGSMPSLSLPIARPTLAVKLEPPSPSSGDKDMAELHARDKKVSGHKKWFLAFGLAAIGAAVGFVIGGPVGAAAMGAGAGFAGHRAGHFLWG